MLCCFLKCHILSKTSNSEGFIIFEDLKLNENVGAPQPDALAQIASVDPSPAVGGMHRFTPAMLSRLKKQRQLLSELEHALKNHEFCFFLEPKLLLAEITETMLAENASLVENTIQGLHRKGFSVMMDDFGSGYSSLNMLKDTNVDAIKLDMKLIDMNQQNRSNVLTGDIVERTYKKTDGTTFRINVTPYSKRGTHIDETIWIFSDEGASLTPPPRQNK